MRGHHLQRHGPDRRQLRGRPERAGPAVVGGDPRRRPALRPDQRRQHLARLCLRGMGSRRCDHGGERLRQRVVRAVGQPHHRELHQRRRQCDVRGRRRQHLPDHPRLPAVDEDAQPLRRHRHDQEPERRHHLDPVPPGHGLGHRADRLRRGRHPPARQRLRAGLHQQRRLRHRGPAGWSERPGAHRELHRRRARRPRCPFRLRLRHARVGREQDVLHLLRRRPHRDRCRRGAGRRRRRELLLRTAEHARRSHSRDAQHVHVRLLERRRGDAVHPQRC